MSTFNSKKQLFWKKAACELWLTNYILDHQHHILANACRQFLTNMIPDMHFEPGRWHREFVPFCDPRRSGSYFRERKTYYTVEDQIEACRDCFQKLNSLPNKLLTYLVQHCKGLPFFMTFFNSIYHDKEHVKPQMILTKQEFLNMWDVNILTLYEGYTEAFLLHDGKQLADHKVEFICSFCQNNLCAEHQHCTFSTDNETKGFCTCSYRSNLDNLTSQCMPSSLKDLLSTL